MLPTAEPAAASTWDDVLRSAIERSDVGLLTATCLSIDLLVPAVEEGERAGGLPLGRPSRAVARAAAAALVDAAAEPGHRAIGLLFGSWQAQPARHSETGNDERPAHVSETAEAVELCRPLGGGMLAWALLRHSRALDQIDEWARAMEVAREAALLAEQAMGQRDDRGPFAMTTAPLMDPDQGDHICRVIAFYARRYTGMSARSAGDFDAWRDSVAAIEPLLEPLARDRPSLVAMALAQRALLARATGDRDTAMVMESRLGELAERTGAGQRTYRRQHLSVAAYNAQALKDWHRSLELHRARFELALSWLPDGPEPGVSPRGALPALLRARERGLRTIYNNAANAAYDSAAALWRSGITPTDPAAHALAVEWLDVADALWRGWADNGLWAVRATRARLRAVDPQGGNPAAAVPDLVEVARSARQQGLRVSAISAAATYCAPGDPEVLDATEQLMAATSSPRERARLLAARAEWSLRYARQGGETSRFEEADGWAAQALEVMGGGPRSATPTRRPLDTEAWVLASSIRADCSDALERGDRLEHLRAGVLGVAQLLLDVGSHANRQRLARRHAGLVRSALEEAVAAGDPVAVDQILEVLRRDTIGVLLTELSDDPEVPDEVRQPVQRLLATMSAGPPVEDGSDDKPNPGAQRALERATVHGEAQRERANDQVDQVLGALAALADVRTLDVRAADVLQGRDAFLLQLIPTTLPLLDDGREHRLVRRCTWAGGEWLDDAPLPRGLVGETRPTRRFTDGSALLPPPVLEALAGASPDDPVRLLVVPSGLFHLHLDALVLPDGDRLLRRAATSVHTSLSAAVRLLGQDDRGRRGAAAAYDEQTLLHTASEREALERWFTPVEPVRDRARLLGLGERADRLRVLGLGVHGSDDADGGWGQAKRLPSGETVTAAQALAGRYPAVCVLASCHSQVRTRAGLDLAGFPLALFSRGASTVLGTLEAVEDEATAQIVARFYALLAAGTDPVRALHRARVDWIAEEPGRLGSVERWSRLVLYGGAHC